MTWSVVVSSISEEWVQCVSRLRVQLVEMNAITLKRFWPSARSSLALTIMLVAGLCGSARADNAQYFYDPAGRLVAVVDPVNGSAQYTYDAVGNILSVVRRSSTDLLVAQVSPTRGRAGDTVTIFGTGFGSTADTTVSFNGVAATPTAVSANQITVTVPAGAQSGPVAVTSPAGTGVSVAAFTVPTSALPTIASISPGQANPGDTITVTGSNFDPVLANNKVLVNDRYAQVTAVTSSSLTAIVPRASSGHVSVATPQGTVTSSGYVVIPPAGYAASQISSVVTAAIGGSGTVSTAASGSIGLILFDATSGQRVAFQVTASSVSSGNIQLYGPDGAPVGSSAGTSTGSFLGGLDLALSGTYVLVVAPPGSGAVTIGLLDATSVTGSISADAVPVSLTTTRPGQNMKLSFAGTANERVSLQAQIGGSLGCTGFTVVEPDGRTQLYSVSGCPSTWFSGLLILPWAGTYTILLNPIGAGTGASTFTLYNVPPDASAAITPTGSALSLTTTAPSQNMTLSFTGAANQRVSLQAQIGGSLGCTGLTVVEPDGKTQLYNVSGCPSTWYSGLLILPVAGTYTILLSPIGSGIGTATFTLYNVPPDASAAITPGGSAVSLTTTTPAQNMTLSFTGAANQRVSLQAQIGGSLGCTALTLVEPDGKTQLYNVSGCPSTWYSGLLTLPVAGTYTILLSPIGAGIGTTTFTLYNVPPDASAAITPGGSAVSLTTTAPGQNMTLSFTGAANQRVSLLAQIGSNLGCTGLTVVEPDGATKLYNVSGCPSSWFSDPLILPVAGTYTILLNAIGSGTGTATFTLYNMPADASATVTPGGGAVSLTTTTPGQNMTLSFAGAANERVSLLAQVDSNLGCTGLTLTEPDGKTQLYNVSGCPSTWFSGPLILPTAGTYTILLSPIGTGIGTTTFTLYDVPADVAGTTNVGQAAANYTTTVPGQAIRVSFTGAASQSITVVVGEVSSTPSGACYNITTLKPDGSTLRGDGSCGANYSSGSLTLPTAGTYTVVVAPISSSIGTFSVGVNTP